MSGATDDAVPARPAPPVRAGRAAGSQAQQQRRRRILDVTLGLASAGGYDAVQMREVAAQAGVALGTLYRYFPSKIHLLLAAVVEEMDRVQQSLNLFELPGRTPYDRLLFMLEALAQSLQRDPNRTEALTRAVIVADGSARSEIDSLAEFIYGVLARAFTEDDPTEEHLAMVRVVGDVWLANMIAWITYRCSPAEVVSRLKLTIALLLSEDGRHPVAV